MKLRLLVVLLGACAALALGAARASAAELLPDLDANPASRLSVLPAPDGSSSLFLTFNGSFSNLGKGPLVIAGHRADVAEPTMVADQVIANSDGTETTRPGVGTLIYDDERRRWGFSPIITYELRALGGPVGGVGPDVGFCLIDTRPVDLRDDPPAGGASPFRDCGSGREGLSLLELRMGVSVGWMNWHKAGNKGQLIDITTLAPGRYVLVTRVNPSGALAETSSKNNASSVLLELTRPGGGQPQIKVLRECPDSGKCKPQKPRRDKSKSKSTSTSDSRDGKRDARRESLSARTPQR